MSGIALWYYKRLYTPQGKVQVYGMSGQTKEQNIPGMKAGRQLAFVTHVPGRTQLKTCLISASDLLFRHHIQQSVL